MVSISSGVAITNVYVNDYYLHWYPNKNCNYNKQGVFSIPIEFKAFWLANNYIGIGVHVAKNIIPSATQFSPFYFGISLITGFWNIPRKVKVEHPEWNKFIKDTKDWYQIK